MINNFETIKKLLQFESIDDFYHLQIMKRKKEHPELGSNSYIVKTYYVKRIEELDFYKGEIITLCKYHNARAGINLNKRSFEKLAFQMIKKVADQIMNKDYKSIRKAFESVTGSYSNEKEKKWIIDIDHKNRRTINQIMVFIDNIEPYQNRFITLLETKNGFHLITKPFNVQLFKEIIECNNLEIHKDNPTILYIP